MQKAKGHQGYKNVVTSQEWLDFLKEFETDLLIRGKSTRAIQSQRSYIKTFLMYLESINITEVQDLSRSVLKGFQVYLIEQNKYTTKTINRFVALVRNIIRYGKEEGIFTTTDEKALKYVKEIKPVINTFTDAEALRIINYWKVQPVSFMATRNHAIITTLFETGLRNQELCNLKFEDLRENYIVVFNGKGGKSRVVPYTPELKKVMNKWIRVRAAYMKKNKQEATEYVFTSYRGSKLTTESVENVTRATGKAIRLRADCRCNPHNFRHFFCTRMLKNGLDLYSVSKLMGHDRLDTTQIYLNSLTQQDVISMSMNASVFRNLIKK